MTWIRFDNIIKPKLSATTKFVFWAANESRMLRQSSFVYRAKWFLLTKQALVNKKINSSVNKEVKPEQHFSLIVLITGNIWSQSLNISKVHTQQSWIFTEAKFQRFCSSLGRGWTWPPAPSLHSSDACWVNFTRWLSICQQRESE